VAKMKMAVISDLHLGRGDLADLFGHEDGKFVRFLQELENNFEKIVLLGDIFEVLGAPRLGSSRSEFEQIHKAHPEIVGRLLSPRYIYVHGNHDYQARKVHGAPSAVLVEDHGMRILLTHGHHFDWLHRARWLSALAVWLGAWTRRLGGSALCRLRSAHAALQPKIKESPLSTRFQRWAIALAEARGADVVVTGHTHSPCVRKIGARFFINSGACFAGRFEFLNLDTRTKTFEVRTWS